MQHTHLEAFLDPFLDPFLGPRFLPFRDPFLDPFLGPGFLPFRDPFLLHLAAVQAAQSRGLGTINLAIFWF